VITITVLTILTLGVIPLMKVSVKRHKEQQLRETLREIRTAIDQFHREALAAPIALPGTTPNANPNANPNPPQTLDPRIRVYVSDQTIFTVDNPDRYPPDLETLVKGVDVMPFATGVTGGRGNLNVNATDVGKEQVAAKKKVYLRAIPIDPMSGKAEWDFRSCYDSPDSNSWGGENVFDVHSKSKETALNGEKYSDW
jgi:general secretion pathway protein G